MGRPRKKSRTDEVVEELKQAAIWRAAEDGRLIEDAEKYGFAECPDCGGVLRVVPEGGGSFRISLIKHRV